MYINFMCVVLIYFYKGVKEVEDFIWFNFKFELYDGMNLVLVVNK